MGRYQSGHIYEASGAFFVRYYVSAIVDGKASRVQRSYRVCGKDDKYHSPTCKAVKQKAAEHMDTVNANAAPVNDQTIAALLGKDVPALRGGESPSHDRSRLQTNLGPAFEHALSTIALKDYKTHMGVCLSRPLRRNSVGRRFSTSDLLRQASSPTQSTSPSSSPTHGTMSKCSGRPRNPPRRLTTRLKRLKTSSPLSSSTSIVALAFFLGLWPEEIQGLRWEDIDSGRYEQGLHWIQIRGAVARNVIGVRSLARTTDQFLDWCRKSRLKVQQLGPKRCNLDASHLLVQRAHLRLKGIPLVRSNAFSDAARYSGGIPSTISTAAVPRTSKTWGGKAFVSTVKATFGFAFSADTLGASGTVQRTNSAPFQWKPIGIARGNPSGPIYANRAGILDCISSCAKGSLSTRATSFAAS